MSDIELAINNKVRENLIKETAIDLCAKFPQTFQLRPHADKPDEPGPWGNYPFDDVMSFFINSTHQEALNFYSNLAKEEREIAMTTALSTEEQADVYKLIQANVSSIKNVLPSHCTPERMLRIAYSAVKSTPELARCNQLSLMNAIVESSMLGLEVNTPLGFASLIPYKKEVKLIIEYKGKIELAYRSGKINNFSAHPVYEKDHFKYCYGLNPILEHVPSREPDPGPLVYAYAVAKFKGEGFDFEVVDERIAMSAKDRSQARKSEYSPWNTDDEHTMWVKTAVHRLWKRLPKSPEIIRALKLDEAVDKGEKQNFGHIIDADFQQMPDAKDPEPDKKTEKTEPKTERKTTKKEKGKPDAGTTVKSPIFSKLFALRDEMPEQYAKASKALGINADTILNDEMAKTLIATIGEIVDKENE